jgi:hypothetical protein
MLCVDVDAAPLRLSLSWTGEVLLPLAAWALAVVGTVEVVRAIVTALPSRCRRSIRGRHVLTRLIPMGGCDRAEANGIVSGWTQSRMSLKRPCSRAGGTARPGGQSLTS